MIRVRLLGVLATAMVATAAPAFAEGPTTGGATVAPAATQAATAAPVANRASAFLKVDGPQGMIQGESTDAAHPGWIELMSFQFGASASTGAGTATGAGAGRANLNEITITKRVDKASTALRLAFASGQHIKEVILHCRKAGSDGTVVYYQVTLQNVLISSDRGGGTGAGVPTESLSLNFTKMNVEYTPQKPDGTLGTFTPVRDGYDVKANVKL
jgi:type VI secretion system secreted protein Hcp